MPITLPVVPEMPAPTGICFFFTTIASDCCAKELIEINKVERINNLFIYVDFLKFLLENRESISS
jgi:hypothetical protein